jgi:hypothetical protein
MQPRQPTFMKEKPPTKIGAESIYGKNTQASKVGTTTGSKIGGKTQSKFGNAGKMLVGQHKKQFDDIPDSVSHFSKPNKPSKLTFLEKKKLLEKDDKLTAKPNEYILDKKLGTATLKQQVFSGHTEQKDITDKPNNIRAPISFGTDFDSMPRF